MEIVMSFLQPKKLRPRELGTWPRSRNWYVSNGGSPGTQMRVTRVPKARKVEQVHSLTHSYNTISFICAYYLPDALLGTRFQ